MFMNNEVIEFIINIKKLVHKYVLKNILREFNKINSKEDVD